MTEYPFKDLLPLDEALEREGYYKDWTHLDPDVFYSLTQISEYIKTKGYGVDVRLLIAQLAEHFSLKTSQINQIELFFKDVMQELAEDKDYHSLPEIAGARGGFDTLGERLNNETFDMSRMGQDVKEAMTGGSVAVVGKNSILTENIVDHQVNYKKTDMFKLDVSQNMFDGNYLNAYVGGGDTNFFYVTEQPGNTAVIKVEPNTTYSIFVDLDAETLMKVFPATKKLTIGDKGDQVSGELGLSLNRGKSTLFTTLSDTEYLYINTTASGEPAPYLKVVKSNEIKPITSKHYPINPKKLNIYNKDEVDNLLQKDAGLKIEQVGGDVRITPQTMSKNKIIYEYGRHVNESIQLDVWRLKNIYLHHHETGVTTPITSGDNEGVLRIRGEADYLGGIHGDEIMTDMFVYVNGVEQPIEEIEGDYDSIEFVTFTDLFHADTPNKAFTKERSVLFDKTGVHIKSRWHALGTFELTHVRASILSIHKKEAGLDLIKTFRTNVDLRPKPMLPTGEITPNLPSHETINEIHLLGGEVSAKLWNISREGSENNNGSITDFETRLKIYIDGFERQTVSQGDIIVDEHKFVITTL